MSGAMFLMTKMLRPTGGWISPISMTIVMATPNQIRSKPAALRVGSMIGAVIRMIDDRRQEEAEHDDHAEDHRQQHPFRELQRDDSLTPPPAIYAGSSSCRNRAATCR